MVQMQTIRAFSFLCPPPDTVSFLFGLTSAVYYLTIGCVLSDLRLRVRLRCIFPLITHSATPTTQQDLVCERTTELGSTLQNIWFFIYVGPHRVPEKGFEVAY